MAMANLIKKKNLKNGQSLPSCKNQTPPLIELNSHTRVKCAVKKMIKRNAEKRNESTYNFYYLDNWILS